MEVWWKLPSEEERYVETLTYSRRMFLCWFFNNNYLLLFIIIYNYTSPSYYLYIDGAEKLDEFSFHFVISSRIGSLHSRLEQRLLLGQRPAQKQLAEPDDQLHVASRKKPTEQSVTPSGNERSIRAKDTIE